MKQSTQAQSPSETAPTKEPVAEPAADAIAKFAATLDKDFPSVIVSGAGQPIDEQANEYGQGRQKPDFVRADDAGWDAPTQAG